MYVSPLFENKRQLVCKIDIVLMVLFRVSSVLFVWIYIFITFLHIRNVFLICHIYFSTRFFYRYQVPLNTFFHRRSLESFYCIMYIIPENGTWRDIDQFSPNTPVRHTSLADWHKDLSVNVRTECMWPYCVCWLCVYRISWKKSKHVQCGAVITLSIFS